MSALDVRCPACGSDAGEQCVTHAQADLISARKRGKTKRDRDALERVAAVRPPHEARVAAANAYYTKR